MPDAPLTPDRRTLATHDDGDFAAPARAPFVELGLASCFSFLEGASDAVDLVTTAHALGYDAIGIADRNSMAGVVRIHTEAGVARLTPVIGCRLATIEGYEFLAYPTDRAAYGRLCTMLSTAKMRTHDGQWQAKGACDLTLAMVAAHGDGIQLIALPPGDIDAAVLGPVPEPAPPDAASAQPMPSPPPASGHLRLVVDNPAGADVSGPPRPDAPRWSFAAALPALAALLPGLGHVAVRYLYQGDDAARIAAIDALAASLGLGIVATNDVLYHAPDRRPLQDVMTAIRHRTTVAAAGLLLTANAERHLKSPAEMARLFEPWPHAIAAARAIADACRFSLSELTYDYPTEIVPDGQTPQQRLEVLAAEGAARRYPDGVPDAVASAITRELALIGKLDLARYFLTIKDIVDFARGCDPPILCQGRGSAANSAVCYCLEITAVDPARHALLFDRFISEERREPPDIDVDFEHERREEVIQYIYRKYGRHRAGLAATVIHYRPRMAIREVGKAMGLTEDTTANLARTVWGSWGTEIAERHVGEAGLDATDPHLRRVLKLTEQMIGMPRHLSQHVGGFVLTAGPLTQTVPIGNGAMPDRSFIEWDKDDIEALGILKVDVLALGMLTCIQKCLALLGEHHDRPMGLADVPREDPAVYRMLQKGDSLGVFQVESRAQMNMLPRLKPREFYDLVIQVAIVRPGPIQGDMVHPYLKRRRGAEPVQIPAPSPEHGPPDELSSILGRTLGVPIFQEQAMKIALDAARFSSAEANKLRKAMATFRSRGMVDALQDMMVGRMVARGYDGDFAQRCFNQIRGFGEYGFPESHAASFAHLVYVSSWLKCHYPAAFCCALLNSQPMGFYAPAQIVRDAVEHGVHVLPVDVNASGWDNAIERVGDGAGRARAGAGLEAGLAVRLGLRQIDGFPEAAAARLVAARERMASGKGAAFTSTADLKEGAGLTPAQIERLAGADALGSLGLDRRRALWEARSLVAAPELPLFAAARAAGAHVHDEGEEADAAAIRGRLPVMPLSEQVVADYQTLRLSLKAHPMAFLRADLGARGFVKAADLRQRKFRSMIHVAGVVLIRQRPGSAKGVCFITLEDETGVINLVVWPDMMERHRRVVMGARLIEVRGRVEYDDEVIHVIAHHLVDASDRLAALSDDVLMPTIARADHVSSPLPGGSRPHATQMMPGRRRVQPCGPDTGHAAHPRDVRIIPKILPPSRDFH